MSLNLNLNNLLWLSIFIVLTIGETTTNYLHLEINGYIRLLINLFLIIIFLLKFFLGSIEKSTLIIFSFQIFLISYGFILSNVYGGEKYFNGPEIGYLIYSTIFLFAILEVKDTNISMMGYIFLVIFISIITGGLQFNPMPELDLVMVEGEYRDYSQGVTGLYGAFALFLYSDILKKFSIIKIVLFLLCFVISILGAARGDFIAVGLVLFAISFMRSPVKTIVFSISLLILILSFIDLNELSQTLLLIERFSQLGGGNLGMRDYYWGNSLDLIANSSNTIFGNGFNYFQIFHDYDYGGYPHNILLEMIITFGITGFFIASLSVIGFFANLKKISDKKIIFLMLIYLILMKSGNLFNFFALPVLLYFAHDAVKLIISFFKNLGENNYFLENARN